jgi:hypothetical protein
MHLGDSHFSCREGPAFGILINCHDNNSEEFYRGPSEARCKVGSEETEIDGADRDWSPRSWVPFCLPETGKSLRRNRTDM